MQEIKYYLSIIDPRLLHHLKGKSGTFVKIFREKEYLSEDAFKEHFYKGRSGKNGYNELKSRTINILQAFALVSKSRSNSLVKKKYDFCLKNFSIGQKFMNQGVRSEGIRLIKKAYRTAVEFEFVHLACELSSILYHDHIYYHKKNKEANFYAQQAEQYFTDYIAEKKMEHQFYLVISQITKSLQPSFFERILNNTQELKGQSVKYTAYRSMVKVLYHLNRSDYESVIKVCLKTLDFFESKKGVYNSHRQFFLTKLSSCQIAMAQYAEAEVTLAKAKKYAAPRSVNEYIIALYLTINALHTGNYQLVYDLYRQNRRCRFDSIRQQFAIIEAYLCFLAHLGYLQLENKFRLGKYLNETFKAQTDKRGSNIAIIIAELLVLLAKNRGKFIDRVDAIGNYSYRHLTSRETLRAKYFIKILCLIPKANFHAIAFQRIATKHLRFLETNSIYMGYNGNIEIIPFEDLLGMIMQQLERKVA